MKYAVISDIHGNMPAFAAVLRDAEKQGVDSFILLGDYCPGFPFVNEVVDAVRGLKNACILKGNEDDYVLDLTDKDLSLLTDGQFRTIYWTFSELWRDNLGYLASLPDRLELSEDVSCSHKPSDFFGGTSLDSLSSHFYADEAQSGGLTCDEYLSSKEKALACDSAFLERLEALPARVFIFGHVHMQYHYGFGGKYIVNPGSCGLPLDSKPGAPYTIVEISGGACLITERRAEYDKGEAVSALKKSTLYNEAPVWSEIISGELESSLERVKPFLRHAEAYAKSIGDRARPFTRETFAAAYKSWLSGPVYGKGL